MFNKKDEVFSEIARQVIQDQILYTDLFYLLSANLPEDYTSLINQTQAITNGLNVIFTAREIKKTKNQAFLEDMTYKLISNTRNKNLQLMNAQN